MGGEQKMKKMMVCLALAWTTIFCTTEVHADYLYDWENLPRVKVLDLVTDGTNSGRDIATAWLTQNRNYHYFHVNLRKTPDNASPGDNDENHIDSAPWEAEDADFNSLSNNLSGIDYVVDAHYNPNTDDYRQIDFHYLDGSDFQKAKNNGKTPEWEVTLTSIQFNNFTWQTATLTNAHATTFLFNETEQAASSASPVPIPAPLWLFASGIIGLVGLCRKG